MKKFLIISIILLMLGFMPAYSMEYEEKVGSTVPCSYKMIINDSDYAAAIRVKTGSEEEPFYPAGLVKLKEGFFRLPSQESFSLNSCTVQFPLKFRIAILHKKAEGIYSPTIKVQKDIAAFQIPSADEFDQDIHIKDFIPGELLDWLQLTEKRFYHSEL